MRENACDDMAVSVGKRKPSVNPIRPLNGLSTDSTSVEPGPHRVGDGTVIFFTKGLVPCAGREDEAFFPSREGGKEILDIVRGANAILGPLSHEKGRLAGDTRNGGEEITLGREKIRRKTQRDAVMAAVLLQCLVDQGIKAGVVAFARLHPGTEGQSREAGRKKTRDGYLQTRLPVGGNEQRRTDPDPAHPVERLRQPAEPVQHEKGTGGMGKDSAGTKIEGRDDLLEKPTRLGHCRHVAPHPVRLTVPRPVKADGTVAGIGKEGSGPVMACRMVPEPVEQENLSLFRNPGEPFADTQLYTAGCDPENAVCDRNIRHPVTLDEVRKYSSCG